MGRLPVRMKLGLRSSRLLPAVALAFFLLGAASASAITRATVLARAQSWVDIPVPYSQTHYFRGYRTDCSGFASMSWQTRSNGHPTSYSTRSLHEISTTVTTATILPGDAVIKHNYHAIVFYGWLDATHDRYVAYEQTGPTTKSSIRTMTKDLVFGYRLFRYKHVTADAPQWNALLNPTFDVWASGAPVWWQVSGGWASAVCTRSVDVRKAGHNALGLLNRAARTRDVVEVSQTTSVTAGLPYTTSLWAYTGADPAGLTLRLRYLDGTGNVISTMTTSGVDFSIETTALGRMAITTTAPAEATAAIVTVRLAGGVDASGTAGTSAVIDALRMYVSTPVSSDASISGPSTTRHHAVTVSGRVAAPIPYGTVRVYMVRPDRKQPIALLDKKVVGGAWTMKFSPGLRGTYKFTAKYLGYGPWGPVTSAVVTLKVK